MKLEDARILITGGASGLGAACAKYFVGKGARVTIADLNEKEGMVLAKELGDKAYFVSVDVSEECSVKEGIQAHIEKFSYLNGLIQCAGLGTPSKLLSREGEAKPLASFAKVIEVNLIGSINVIRLACEKMVQNVPNSYGEKGVVINTASVAAFDGQIGQTAYAASKGGIVAMTLPLARELSSEGIRVCTIAPGIFDTPMLAGLPEKARLSLGQQVPFPSRLGFPAEYAQFASQIFENVMLNGETIRLDGALRMAMK